MGKWSDYTKAGANWDLQNLDEARKANQAQAEAAANAPVQEQQNTQNVTAPVVEESPHRVWDLHLTPQYFLDEQQNRKNPDYVSDMPDIDTASVDAIANYVQGMKDQNPNEWRYGDPGWMSDNSVYTDYVKPWEDYYQQQQRQTQVAEAQKAQEGVSYTVDPEDERFNKAYVDKSEANYNDLTFSEKRVHNLTPAAAGTDVENTPWYTRWTQPIIGSVMSSSGPAKIAEYAAVAAGAPKVGLISLASRGLTFGYTYGKQRGWFKGNKVVDKFIEMTDILDEKSQQIQGALAYGFEKAGGGNLSDSSSPGAMASNIKFVADNFGTIMHYAFGSGKASTEYAPEVVGAVTGMTANMGATPFVGNVASRMVRSLLSQVDPNGGYRLKQNETTRNNLGLSGVYELDEELMGSNAITFWLEYLQDKYNQGMTNENDLQYALQTAITDYYGDLANFSEFIEHEMTDPGNVTENMESRVVEGYATILGDENLKVAAQQNTGSWAGDLTANVPIIPNLVREIAKLAGHPEVLKTSNGINEVLSTWDLLNVTGDPSELTGRDRRFSGINADNTINRFNKNERTATTPIGRTLEWIRDFFSETNESRAMAEGDAIFDYISLGIEDAMAHRDGEDPAVTMQRVKDFVGELEHPETISANSPFAKLSKSALFNSVKEDLAEAVRTHRDEINRYIDAYEAQNVNRQTLDALATALNMTPQKILKMYEDPTNRATLTQMIVNKAQENGGRLPGIDIDVETPDFGREVIQRIAPFVGDKAEAWDLRQLGLQISTSIADGVSDTIVNKYGIKPDAFIYRFGDTIKKMQNLLLLGLSPSYLANNLVNNVVTRTALGYGGWMSPKTIGDWMNRFGYKPDRMTDSMSGEIGQESQMKGSNYDKLSLKIRDKKKVKGALEKVGKFSSDASKKFGLFGNISGKIEAMESEQILASAMMTYMARTWKAGENFRRMPAQLEAALEAQNPGMVRTIYAAVEAGMNIGEIEKAVFGTYVEPSVKDSLVQAAKNIGVKNADDVITEYFAKSGMLDRLTQALKDKRGDDINAVVQDLTNQLKRYLEMDISKDITSRAKAVENIVTAEGWNSALEVSMDVTDAMLDIWLLNQDMNSRMFQRRIEEGMTPREFHAAYAEQQKNLTERWKNVYAKAEQTWLGILKGMGINNKYSQRYLDTMHQKNQMWVKYFEETQPQLFQEYLNAAQRREGEDLKVWDARTKKAWKTYVKKRDNILFNEKSGLYKREMDYQIRMDKAYTDSLKLTLGTIRAVDVDQKVVPLMEAIRNKRQELNNQQRVVRSISDNTAVLNEKSVAWTDADAKLKQLKTEYTQLQNEMYTLIQTYNPLANSTPAENINDDVDYEASIRIDVTEKKAEENQKISEAYSEKKTNEQLEGVKPDRTVETVQNELTEARKALDDAIAEYEKHGEGKEAWSAEQVQESVSKRDDVQKLTDKVWRLERELKAVQDLESETNTPDTWKEELRRDNLRDVATKSGATADQADAYARLVGAYGKAWEINHKGKDFFKDALGLSVEYLDEDRTVEITDRAGNTYLIDGVDRANINTPEFMAWHGDHPLNFNKDGTPLSVWHGSIGVFTEFDLSMLGSNTDAPSATLGIFFAGNKETAESYTGKDFELAPDEYITQKIFSEVYPFVSHSDHKATRPMNGIPDISAMRNDLKRAEEVIQKVNQTFPETEQYQKESQLYKGYKLITDELRGYTPEEDSLGLRLFHLETTWNLLRESIYRAETAIDNADEIREKISHLYDIHDPNVFVREFYLSFQNPYVYDFKGEEYREISYYDIIKTAIDGGYDAVIIQNTYDGGPLDNIYIVFKEDQVKSVYNTGEWKDPKNVYHQEGQQKIKGQFKIEDGQKIVDLFRGSDFSTLVHETAHGFSTVLNDAQAEALAAYNGWTLSKYKQLENQFYHDPDAMDAKEKQDWIDAQERFAYGFEQYLLEGKAPNNAMRQVFESFRKFLLDIYKGVRHLVYKGEEIDIHKRQNGVTLAEIFDSMLDGYEGQEETQFNIEYEGLLQTEYDKQLKKFETLKQETENRLRDSAAKFVAYIEKEYGLSVEESTELAVEMMHGLGLNMDLQENEVLKNSLETKMRGSRQTEINAFVDLNRESAVRISDEAIRKYMDDIADNPENFGEWKALYTYQTGENLERATRLRQERAQAVFNDGEFAPLEFIDLTTIEPSGNRNELMKKMAQKLYEADEANTEVTPDKKYSWDEWIKFVYNTSDGKLISKHQNQEMTGIVNKMDPALMEEVANLRANSKHLGIPPQSGDYVAQTYSFDHGGNEIVAVVYRDGQEVAYVPHEFPVTEVQDGDETYKVIGLSPSNPELLVYMVGDDIRTMKERTAPDTNPHSPEVEHGTIAETDPLPEAHSQMMYEDILPIINEFVRLYKQNLDNNMSQHQMSQLRPETREAVRQYIDNDVRQDLMNAKYKTGKFGELIRDSALLNYSKRYGFDNFLTLLCPYQFWMTRSFMRWMDRMGSKGGKMWRKYYKLKELEKRNKKEFMPSKISGKFGIYVPGMPDWMGDSIFMSTDQLFVVNQFMDPLLNFGKNKNSITATAEKYLQEAYQNGDISYEQWQAAMDPNNRDTNGDWQEALAKAQLDDTSDQGIGGLMQNYLGFSLPVSIAQALLTGDQSKWNQFPMTRTGTAFRAIVGDNWVGKLGESIMSAPEKALRKAAVATFGNAFEYNEFGAFGDYYLRNQVFDMVTEGKISPQEAVQACIEKDGNKIWEEAADRQREETLVKMQGGSFIDAAKKIAKDVKDGKNDELSGDWLYLLASFLTIPMSKTVVHESERQWRQERGELNEAYEAKANGDKEAVNKYYDEHPNATYNNLRYESDPETMLRQYLYKNIMDKWYDLDKAEQNQLSMSFGNDFKKYVINKETRAIEAMDLNKLAAYAQALSGSIPYLATDNINTMNVPKVQVMDVPQTTLQQYNTYLETRDKLYPGMSQVNSIYWSLPAQDRKVFMNANPNLAKYQQWDKQYKTDHPDVKQYSKLMSDYYDLREMEEACSLFDQTTMKYLSMVAYGWNDGEIPAEFKKVVERVMAQIGTTDTYKKFTENLMKYILSE